MNIHDLYELGSLLHENNDGWTNKFAKGGNNCYLFPAQSI